MCANMQEKFKKLLPASGMSTSTSGAAVVRAPIDEADTTGAGVSVDSGSGGYKRRRKSSSGLGL